MNTETMQSNPSSIEIRGQLKCQLPAARSGSGESARHSGTGPEAGPGAAGLPNSGFAAAYSVYNAAVSGAGGVRNLLSEQAESPHAQEVMDEHTTKLRVDDHCVVLVFWWVMVPLRVYLWYWVDSILSVLTGTSAYCFGVNKAQFSS
ncbi:hypothetical protein GGX14DRAFT_408351 [Mycena pura]|uniref:Uncharacterized protein n=1 Tax=Mycena pura TaxID=153505 RepID=A0AAD6UQU7_9AGAR|nr:hypothetical protein GGX14DRAFT_408351 [Mycena pura]